MNMKVNGLRIGILTALLAIGAAGCKKEGPFAPMPQGLASKQTEKVVDSFYQDGLKYANNPEYTLVREDTISISNFYAQNPKELAKHLSHWCYENNHITDNNEVVHTINNYEDSKAVISSSQIYTNDSVNSYIAVAEYAKILK